MIPIPIRELSELSGCEIEFARHQIYDGIAKKELVKNVHWRNIRGAILLDFECGLSFLALRRLLKEEKFLSRVIGDLPQIQANLKELVRAKRKVAKSQLAFEFRATNCAAKKIKVAL